MYTWEDIHNVDPEVADLIQKEFNRQNSHIELIASENWASKAVMSAMGSVLTNKYAEGYPGHRYYGGCEYVDEVERLLNEKYGEYCEVFRACPRIIDIHAKGVSKARSARELQQKLGRKILVCVGDGENDVSMLRGADYAFAPADGVVADRFENVCNCADGSVADVIYRKIPEILKKDT